jgi:glycosyltransferase involved in cell wall biosynthesis
MISVIVCTYNRASSLGKTLESLRQMTVPPDLKWELILVDNNSTDKTRTIVQEFSQTSGLNVHYVFEPQKGLSHARNTGIANSTGEIIAFIDDDVRVAPEWLRELEHTFREFDCTGAGGRITPVWDGIIRPKWFATAGPYFLGGGPVPLFDYGDKPKQITAPPVGANMAFRKSAFEKYGLFRPDLGPGGSLGTQLGDDFDFGLRLLRARDKVVYSPRAVVFHPAIQERVTKKYFLVFYYNLGRTETRLWRWPSEAVLYFGIPRYMFRMLIRKIGTWLSTFGRRERFYFRAQVYRLLGQMMEARLLQKEETMARYESQGPFSSQVSK